MEEYIKEVLKITKKHFGRSFPNKFDNFKSFKFPNPNMFQKFLISDRIIPFQKLMAINQFKEGSKFYVGFKNFFQYNMYEDLEEYNKEYGPTLMHYKFSKEMIFNYILGKLGFDQIIIKNPIDHLPGNHYDKNGMITDLRLGDEFKLGYEDEFIIRIKKDSNVIISQNIVYYEDKEIGEKIKNAISFHSENFNKFLKKYKEKCIPHSLYIDMLLTWFPGRINVRSIS